jgi:hypothetical protein
MNDIRALLAVYDQEQRNDYTALSFYSTRSTIVAMPWPTPMHMVARP